MKRLFVKTGGWSLSICMCAILAGALASPSMGQEEKKVTQTAGVDNTKMGAYRALAQLSFQAFQKGDSATAAELARVLERTWDAAEGGGGEHSLGKTNADSFEKIDGAMDVFIKPVIGYASKAPDPAAVQAAYNDYLDKLKQGDQ
jgi:hypothetical protein